MSSVSVPGEYTPSLSVEDIDEAVAKQEIQQILVELDRLREKMRRDDQDILRAKQKTQAILAQLRSR